MKEELIEHYKNSIYRAFGSDFKYRGNYNRWLKSFDCSSITFITAENPYSKKKSGIENWIRRKVLLLLLPLHKKSSATISSEGGEWVENALVVKDLSLKYERILLAILGQNASGRITESGFDLVFNPRYNNESL